MKETEPDGQGEVPRKSSITRSELITQLSKRQKYFSTRDVDKALKTMIEHMIETLARGGRIEIRGFGSFSLHYRQPRAGHNPKTGESVGLPARYVPHFKPGKELREQVNAAYLENTTGEQGHDDPESDGSRQI